MIPAPTAYRPAQIWLHWVVVLGVILQIAFHDAIVAVIGAREAGQAPAAADVTGAWAHVGVGIAILVAVIARLALRWRFGAPGHAPDASALRVAKDGLLDDLKKALSDGF